MSPAGRTVRHSLSFASALLVLLLPASWAADAPLAPKLTGLGDLQLEIATDSEEAQAFFDQGLRLIYAFNHAEAVRAFRESARLDPEAPMPHWGRALALGPNLNDPMPKEREIEAAEAIEQARALSANGTELEREMIEALAVRYSKDDASDRAASDLAWVDAARELSGRYPDHADLKTLFAAAIMNTMPWDYWEPAGAARPLVREAEQALEEVIASDPRHPGAHHYYIHLEEAKSPDKAVPSAEALGALMPNAGHLVHMPAHIFIRVGRYHDASISNQRAIQADEDYLAQCAAQGMYPVGYYPHNIHFLWAAASFEGRRELAVQSADKLASEVPMEQVEQLSFLENYLATPIFARVRFGLWEELRSLEEPAKDHPFLQAMWHYGQGMAAAAQGDPKSAKRHSRAIRKLERHTKVKQMNVTFTPAEQVVALTRLLVEAERASARGRLPRAIAKLREAVALQDTFRYSEPPTFHYPVRHSLGSALLEAGDASAAAAVYRRDLEENPDNGWSLYGLRQSLESLDRTESQAVAEAFRKAWVHADTELSGSAFR